MTCLDHPEQIKLRRGNARGNLTSLNIKAFYCRGQERCETDEEIENWQSKPKIFGMYSNSRKYQPNGYDEILLEYID